MTKPIAPAAFEADAAPLPETLAFSPVPVAPRHDGWTAARQRLFIATLAETACVSEACEAAGVTLGSHESNTFVGPDRAPPIGCACGRARRASIGRGGRRW